MNCWDAETLLFGTFALDFHNSPNSQQLLLRVIAFRSICNAWHSSSVNVFSTKIPYNSILQVLTMSSESSESSVESVLWVEKARNTFLFNISAVRHPMVHLRDAVIVRGAVSGPLITEVVVTRSMLSVPKKLRPYCYQTREMRCREGDRRLGRGC